MQTHQRVLARTESLFHRKLNKEDRDELLNLQTLRELPKSRYATQSCITGIPSGRGRKVVYSHVEVYKMVENIATALREAGVRPQTVCAFIIETCIEAIVYFLALQWIGAIAVPIDPNLSKEEITHILRQVNAHTVVSALVDDDEQAQDEIFNKIQDVCQSQNIIQWYISRSTNRGVFLDMKGVRAGQGAAWSGGAGDFKFDPTEPCVRLASAFNDKCIAIELSHKAVALATREFSKTYSLTAEYSTLLVSPFYSIHGLMCVLASIYSGGNVVIVDENLHDTETILKHIKENKIDWLSINPDIVLDMHEKASANESLLEGINLSFIRTIGGNIHAESLRQVEQVLQVPVLAAYGTTETCGLVAANKEFDFRPETCGKAVGGCEICIFDPETKEKLPPDTVGQIGVYGSHVTKGYIGNDYANTAWFVEGPSDNPSKEFFLTGDEGLLTEAGFLQVTSYKEYRGRAAALAEQEERDIISRKEMSVAHALAEQTDTTESEKALETASESSEAVESSTIVEKSSTRTSHQSSVDSDDSNESDKISQPKRDESNGTSNDLALEGTNTDSYSVGESVGQVESENKKQLDQSTSYGGSVSTTVASSVARTVPEPAHSQVNDEMLKKIMERLDQIERNQKRLEEEIEARHRMEMSRMRELIEEFQDSKSNVPAPAPTINMDVINTAVKKAAASAQSSSRDTAAAAKAAKEAAASAAAVAAAKAAAVSNVVEVVDPTSVQKTVMVSLDEVEDAIKLHPAVGNARAFGRPDKRYGMEVFCAVSPKSGARVSEPWLMLHAQSLLPAAFVPKRFFYKEYIETGEDRNKLSMDRQLPRISGISGFSNKKIVRSPVWTPQNVA